MIYFDHTFTSDPNHRFHSRMETLGFHLMSQETEHPGKMFCRFVAFENKHRKQYLEFVYTKPGGKKVNAPGISFGYRKNLEGFYRKLNKKKSPYKNEFIHKNYEWKRDNKSRLPGWNFLIFKKIGFNGIFPWLTEYEPNKKRKRILKSQLRHPNGVQHIHGFSIELNPKGKRFFSYLLGRKLRPVTKLSCGTNFYFKEGSNNKIHSVILKSKNLQYTLKKYPMDGIVKFRDQDAALIKNPTSMWDILII